MGIDADAHVAYGIPLGTDKPDAVTEEQWETYLETWDTDAALQGFEIVTHGYCLDQCSHFIAMPGTLRTAYCGEPKPLKALTVNAETLHKYRYEIADKLGLDPKTAGWHLFVYYG